MNEKHSPDKGESPDEGEEKQQETKGGGRPSRSAKEQRVIELKR